MLIEELNRLTPEQLIRVCEIWGPAAKIPKDKRSLVTLLKKTILDEFYLKGVLEKLTPIQVQIYSVLIASKSTLTLGEVSRRIRMQPINVEKELAVLKHLMLVYQRKNRERITSNLDKYFPYEEIREIVSISENNHGEKFKLSVIKIIDQGTELDPKYKKLLGRASNVKKLAETAIADDVLEGIIKTLNDGERALVDEAFGNGGICEIHAARIVLDEQKLDFEKTIRKIDSLNILKDVYFIDERFVRILVLPIEVFDYLKRNPLFPKQQGIRESQQKIISNEMDFILNMKKLLLFISNKGLTLSQSEKIKQADMKKSETAALEMDLRLFPEKSQVHLIEITLPFLKLFDLVELRQDNIILKEAYEEFLTKNPLDLLKEVLKEVSLAAEKRMVGNEVFLPIDIPFFKQDVLNHCVSVIKNAESIYCKVLVSELLREWVVLSPGFRVHDFKATYIEKRSEIVSALFYMHLFGLLEIEYPKRLIRLSQLGLHYFDDVELSDEDKEGALIVNADATIIAMPDKLSLFGIHMLKSFTELAEFDRVYHFQVTKESLQQGILLGNKIEDFLEFLKVVSKNRIPQNLMFLISEWSEDLPIVTIEEGVVLLETTDSKLTELLLGQMKGKKILKKELSSTAMVISKSKINEVMEMAEKHEMIVKLVR